MNRLTAGDSTWEKYTSEFTAASSVPACRDAASATRRGKVSAMPAHAKGDRKAYTVRPPIEVAPLLEEKFAQSGVSSMAQYMADLLAIHAGRPDLVRELGKVDKEVLPLAM